MSSYRDQGKYIDLKINGRLQPSWILKNFGKFKVPEYMIDSSSDPCNRKTKLALRSYQLFISSYLDYRSPYHDILLYHGLGKIVA